MTAKRAQRAARPMGPGLDGKRKVRVSRVAFAATLATVCGLGLSALTAPGASWQPRTPRSDLPPELEAKLTEIRGAWEPDVRRGLLKDAADCAHQYRRDLLTVLSRASHPLFREAVELISTHELVGAVPLLRTQALTGPDHVRGVCMWAVEDLVSWEDEDLAEFIRSDIDAVVATALEILTERKTADGVVSLLAHGNTAVREAALGAIAASASPSLIEPLAELAWDAEGEALHAALLALGSLPVTAESERFLVQMLSHSRADVRLAALAGLKRREAPLAAAPAVWSIVGSPVGLVEQAQALVTLQETGSVEIREIKAVLSHLHPFVKYFAARCLVAEGDRDGYMVLLDLVELEDDAFDGLAPERASSVRFAISTLFASLAQKSLFCERTAWRAWFDQLERDLGPQTLPLLGL